MGKTTEIFYGPQGDRIKIVVDREETSISNIDLFDAGLPMLKHPESPKLLIENLKMSLISDQNIKLQVGSDRAIEITRSQLGFRSEKQEGDWEQWRLFKSFFDGNGILKLKGDKKRRERTRNMIVEINKKLISAINSALGARIHHKTKLYEYDRKQEIYRLKFLVVPSMASKTEKLTTKELLKEIDLITKSLLGGENFKGDYDYLQEIFSTAAARGINYDHPILKEAERALENKAELRSFMSA